MIYVCVIGMLAILGLTVWVVLTGDRDDDGAAY